MPLTVIVAAYGPARATRKAVKRARSLAGGDGHVVVFGGLVVGRDAARKCEQPGVTVVDATGAGGLSQALERAGDGPVLYVHDDILVTPETLTAMLKAWRFRRGIIVPFSNDAGMDHFCGKLPPIEEAKNEIARAARRHASASPLKAVRPSCLVASAEDLTGLVELHITDPRVRLDVVSLPVSTAPGAVVAHDGVCGARLLNDAPDDKPLLKAVLIVKDESDMLAESLRSLEDLVDEIVVCDTGSTDDTVAIAKSFDATVVEREWREDFARARNEALDAAGDAHFVLSLDADERVVCADPAGLRRVLATYGGEYHAFFVGVENISKSDSVESTFHSPRLFDPSAYRWTGAVHEFLVDSDKDIAKGPKLELLSLVHLGYSEDVVSERGKKQRNLALAKGAYDRGPSPKTAFEYGRAIKASGGEASESYELMKQALDELRAEYGSLGGGNAQSFANILASMGGDQVVLGNFDSALEHAGEAIALVPADDFAAAVYAQAAVMSGRGELAIEHHEAEKASVRPLLTNDAVRTRASSYVAAAYAQRGDILEAVEVAVEALLREPAGFEAWPQLIACLGASSDERALPALLEICLADTTGSWLGHIGSALPPASMALLCLAYCEAGGALPGAVATGLAAALIADLPDVFGALIPHAHKADPQQMALLAQRAVARGRYDLAAALDEVVEAAPAGRA